MSWTKKQLVEQAFEEIGLAAYVFNLKPAQLQRAVRRMDAMIAAWGADGIRINYALPANPQDTNIDADSGIPDWAAQGVYLNLGVALGPGYGKVIGADTKAAANKAYSSLASNCAYPVPQRQMPGTMPAGAGNKPWRGNNSDPFITPPRPHLDAGPDAEIDFN